MEMSREHIVCVDDEEGVLTALRQQLGARFGDECQIAVARSADDALELMDVLDREGEQLACVIADQIMPGKKGVELLEEVHRRHPRAIKILLTGQAGLDAVVYAINNAGLHCYIAKPWDEPDLRMTVENLLAKWRLEQEREKLLDELRVKNQELAALNQSLEHKVVIRTSEVQAAKERLEETNRRLEETNRRLEEANQRLELLAVTDGLTGLNNHRFFQERLALEVKAFGRSGLPLSLLMLDVDHFKHYNDKHGHPAGDQVLASLARILTEGRRANDVIARYGGEEFALLLVGTPKAAAVEIAERIRAAVAAHSFLHQEDQPGRNLTVSLGVASCPDDADDAATLLQAADDALYRAKHAGRNTVCVAGSDR
jgi:diguanylate cyclase (GGDEF)-like protein